MRAALDSPSTDAARRSRDLWLAAAAFALAVGALFGLADIILAFAWSGFPKSQLAGGSSVLRSAGLLVALAAFATIGMALAGSAASRQSRWRRGWLLLAAASLVSVAGMSIAIYSSYATPTDAGYPYHSGTFLTSHVIEAVSELWQAAAAVLVALLFVRSLGRSRARRLGWVATGFAVVWGISMLYLLAESWDPWWHGPMMEWNGIGWPESIVRFAAAVIAAVAFFRAARLPQSASTAALARRERGVAIAALLLLVVYAFVAGDSYWWTGLPWREQALYLLETLPGAATAVAALCAVVAFCMSARSLPRPTPRFAGLRRWFSELPEDE